MKLYYSPGACSLSPHIVLHEAGLPYEAVLVSTKSHKLQDGTDYYSINPLGYVPFLVLDDGDSLHEGPAIVQYLADLAPEKNLAPANGTIARYHLQEWLKVEKDPEAFKAFLDANIYSCADHFEYVQKNGGLKKMQQLRWKEFMIPAAQQA